MGASYKVTLAIPVYNVAEYVEKSLMSALNQTFDDIEFLLIDDKGTDNSMAIVRDIVTNHPRNEDVRIIEHEKNMGIATARNTALDNATGEFLFFLDSDDIIIPDCIEMLYAKMTEYPVDFVASSYQKVYPKGKLEPNICDDMLIEGKWELAKAFFHKRIQRKWLFEVGVTNKLYRHSFLIKNNMRFISGYIIEDRPFIFKKIMIAESCRVISNITYNYVVRPGSISNEIGKVSDKKVDAFFHMLNFEKDQSKLYINEKIYNDMVTVIMRDVHHYISSLYCMDLETKLDKKRVSDILKYPLSFSELKKFKHQKMLNYLLFFIGKMPFFVQSIAIKIRPIASVWRRKMRKDIS